MPEGSPEGSQKAPIEVVHITMYMILLLSLVKLRILFLKEKEESQFFILYHTCQKFKNIHMAIYIPNFALK